MEEIPLAPSYERNSMNWGSFGLFCFVAIGLLMLGKEKPSWFEQMNLMVLDYTSWVSRHSSFPLRKAYELRRFVGGIVLLKEENALLKEENVRLVQWYVEAQRLYRINQGYEKILNVVEKISLPVVSGTVIGLHRGPMAVGGNTGWCLIDVGVSQGVEDNAVVINDSGLVGRVLYGGKKTSRVLLLNAKESRIPVYVIGKGDRVIDGIAVGEGSRNRLRLKFVESDDLEMGNIVMTSGQGGVFPPDLPVGILERYKDVLYITSFVDFSDLSVVSVFLSEQE